MEISTPKRTEAKKLGHDRVEDLIYADLRVLGYSENDAFAIAYNSIYGSMAGNAYTSACNKVANDKKIKRLIAKRMEQHKSVASIATDNEELMDKTKTARLIMQAAMKQPYDSKERIEGLMKFADIMGYKREEVDENGEETIHFFFPLKCNQCPLLFAYNEFVKANKGKEVRPIEMNAILAFSQPMIEQAQAEIENGNSLLTAPEENMGE